MLKKNQIVTCKRCGSQKMVIRKTEGLVKITCSGCGRLVIDEAKERQRGKKRRVTMPLNSLNRKRRTNWKIKRK